MVSYREQTCTRCGALISGNATVCPVCGANPSGGPLIVRRSNPPALPLRQLAAPVAVGATVVAATAGLGLVRRILPRLRRSKAQPPAVVEPDKPRTGRIIAVRRRVWAVGDSMGARHWGADETVWHAPAQDDAQ